MYETEGVPHLIPYLRPCIASSPNRYAVSGPAFVSIQLSDVESMFISFMFILSQESLVLAGRWTLLIHVLVAYAGHLTSSRLTYLRGNRDGSFAPLDDPRLFFFFCHAKL